MLRPDSTDPSFESIVFEREAAAGLRVVAELVERIQDPTDPVHDWDEVRRGLVGQDQE